MAKKIKPEDLESRIDMTYHELLQQNDDLRTVMTQKMTEANTLRHKCQAYEIDIKGMEERIQELSKYETMDKMQTLDENARLQTQHAEDARTIEHLTTCVSNLHDRINALEGCLTRAHEAILTAQIVDESYRQQKALEYDTTGTDAQ